MLPRKHMRLLLALAFARLLAVAAGCVHLGHSWKRLDDSVFKQRIDRGAQRAQGGAVVVALLLEPSTIVTAGLAAAARSGALHEPRYGKVDLVAEDLYEGSDLYIHVYPARCTREREKSRARSDGRGGECGQGVGRVWAVGGDLRSKLEREPTV